MSKFSTLRLSIVVALLALLGLSAALPANAQDNASVTGVVTDQSGAVVPEVSVTLANPSIGFSSTKTTNAIGVYEFSNVPPASNYSLVFSKSGFSSLTLGKITLNVSSKATRDAHLTIGDSKVTIEVTASASETLNTTDATVGSDIDGERIQDLPNSLVNNAANYLILAPGVTPDGSVTGSRSDQTNITLDGLDVNDQRGGFSFFTTVNTPLDSIQEFKVTSAGDDATYGHSAGGQMELVTKGGTNHFHGQLFEYNRTTDYTANDYFNNLQGIPNPQLIRNQFGGDLGGPIVKGKLFFFFSYNGLRQVAPEQNYLTVPQPWVLNGQLEYYPCTQAPPNPCNPSSTPTTTPTGDATVPNSLANLDPAGIGADQSLLTFLQARGYPAPNNNAVGDGLNTSGYYFVSPVHSNENTYIGKIDYQMSQNHRLSVRGTWDRTLDGGFGGAGVQLFPNDPNPIASYVDHSRAWVVGETWTISPTMTNQASFGETDQVNAFARNYQPTFPNSLSFSDPYYGGVLSNPYQSLNAQFPVVPVYQGRETFTWQHGKHLIQLGGVIAPTIFKSGNLTDTNGYGMGIGGDISGVSEFPSDFGGDKSEWGRLFALVLGRYSGISSGYNYDKAGNPLPQGGVPIRDYHSTQYEVFAQDSWKVAPSFTLTYGVRWQFHKPLTEVNGYEVTQNQTPQSIFNVRLADAAQGISGPNAVPFITYGLGGSANNKPGYYKPTYDNFGPRVGIAYSPSATEGFLGHLFGDRKTSIRAGFGVDFDNNLIGQGFELDETSFLFSNSTVLNYGNLATDPRFSCPSPCTGSSLSASLPAPVPGGTTPRPTFTPNVDANGFPTGFFNAGFGQGAMFNFDPNYKTPYEMHFSLGIQRELPGGWLVEANYIGKLGRRLPALADPAQTLNFVDATSGQSLYNAYGAVQQQVQANTPFASFTTQPWFENQMGAALAQQGFTCPFIGNYFFGVNTTCTQLAVGFAGYYFGDGDTSSMIQTLADTHLTGNLEQGMLLPNVALLAQDGAAGFIGNYSASDYHALIVHVNHRLAHNLTMELNYTYSHSIDNDSGVQNNLILFSSSEICDLRNLRVCRGNSDFDHRHIVASSFEYGLPFGKGRWIAGNSPRAVDELIGGWSLSGIFTAQTGSPFKIDSGAYTIDFTQTQPAVFIGSKADVKGGIHQVSQGAGLPNVVQYFSNVTNAFGAFTAPIAGGPGTRNVISGPGYWDLDLSLLKDFKMPWEGHKLQLKTDALNVFNHTNFNNPGANLLVQQTFGYVTSDAGPRVLQLGLRYIF
ncbi:MAG: carboxypeptidase regulatory-like domain-containing protein [Candidatus Sulfotelmatobacter sp.]